ncbi:hypothetical protein J3E74DRAFT_410989 [Bipolaris maydis]|nr:hypothetical protein J3E74DRAFT_410989 [Bipolaris maydis]
MKLNTIFFAVMASFALAGPLAVPDDVPALISEPKPADVPGNTESTGGESINAAPARDCRQCDDFYRKCMGSTWCWRQLHVFSGLDEGFKTGDGRMGIMAVLIGYD